MEFLKLLPIYFRFLWPSRLRAYIERERSISYQNGFQAGFDKGHRRGWMDLRAKSIKSPNKYPHEPAKDRS